MATWTIYYTQPTADSESIEADDVKEEGHEGRWLTFRKKEGGQSDPMIVLCVRSEDVRKFSRS